MNLEKENNSHSKGLREKVTEKEMRKAVSRIAACTLSYNKEHRSLLFSIRSHTQTLLR